MTSIVLDRHDLADTLAWVTKAIPSRPTVPVLAGVRLSAASDGTVSIAAFDYEHSHEGHLPATVVRPGHVLLPGQLLREIVSEQRGETVSIETNEAENQVAVRAGKSVSTIPTLPLGEWPNLPETPPVVGVTDAADLDALIKSVSWALGNDSVAILTGIHVVGDATTLRAEATNRFSVGTLTIDWKGDQDVDLVIPGKEFATAVGGLKGTVTVHADDNRIALASETRTVTIRRLAGEYPKLRPLFPAPDSWATAVEVDSAELSGAFKRIGVVIDQGATAWVNVNPDDGEVTLTGTGTGSGEEVVDADVTGDPVALGFNPRYVMDALKAINVARVVIGLTPRKAAFIQPAGVDGPAVSALVMPKSK